MTRPADRKVEQARAQVAAARQRLAVTAGTLRWRLSPAHLADVATEQTLTHVDGALKTIKDRVDRQPWLVGLVATLAGIVIAALARRDDKYETNADAEELAPATKEI